LKDRKDQGFPYAPRIMLLKGVIAVLCVILMFDIVVRGGRAKRRSCGASDLKMLFLRGVYA
jgi:hypothetical protein